MAIQQLTLESLRELDNGRVAIAFDHELKQAVLDILDRPGDTTVRKVTLQFDLKPILDEDGECEDVRLTFQTKNKLPVRKTRAYTMGIRKGGQLAFSDISKDGTETMFDQNE